MIDKLKVVKVNILGQDYFIKSSANQTYFKQVEEYINSKTEELIESGLDPDTEQLKIAVLACMNITDELFLYKNQKKEVLSKIESKSNALLEFIDEKLS
tara:strand:+ start:350 stop:646 length:297 start_codon:yes stop_codon:yes gene_type:complete